MPVSSSQAHWVRWSYTECEFSKTSITFLGHKIDQKRIRADPEKTKAIRNMRAPSTVPELKRFMGMVNQLGKFTPSYTVTESTPQQGHRLGVGSQPERRLHTGERGAIQTHHLSLLWRPGSHQTVSGCLVLWSRSSADAADWRAMETSGVRLTLPNRHRAMLRPDWKGGSRNHLGLWEVLRLHPGQRNFYWNWPQTSPPPVVKQTAWQPPPTSSPISAPDGPFHVHHPPCSRQGSAHSKYTVESTTGFHFEQQWPGRTGRTSYGGEHQSSPSREGGTRGLSSSTESRPNLLNPQATLSLRLAWQKHPYHWTWTLLARGETWRLAKTYCCTGAGWWSQSHCKRQHSISCTRDTKGLPTSSQLSSIVARNLPPDRWVRKPVSRVLLRCTSTEGTTDLHTSSRVPMAKGSQRSVWT